MENGDFQHAALGFIHAVIDGGMTDVEAAKAIAEMHEKAIEDLNDAHWYDVREAVERATGDY